MRLKFAVGNLFPQLRRDIDRVDLSQEESMRKKIAESVRLPAAGLRVASFFSGGGGLDLGFHEAGFDVVFCNEIEPVFCETLSVNFAKRESVAAKIVCKDIRQVQPEEIGQPIDFVIGGPPCQTFSASGRRAGGAAGRLDARGTLFESYCRLLGKLNPAGFLFENVRGILGTNRGKDWEKIVGSFRELGYSVAHRIIDACDYGIPQHRERLILVGHRTEGDFLFPEPKYGADSGDGVPHLSPREAFDGIIEDEDLDALKLDTGKYSHLLPLVPPGGNYLFFTAKRGHPKPIFAYRSRFSDFLYKAGPDQPIKTLIASPGKYTGPFHWENRCFSIAEYKRLQGFPDDYEFCGSRSEVIRQIGNSVSPKLATHLALAIAKQIFGRKADVKLMPLDKRLSFDQRKSLTAHRTREKHRQVARSRKKDALPFDLTSYAANVEPYVGFDTNVEVASYGRTVDMRVRGDDSGVLFAKMLIEINQCERDLFSSPADVAGAAINVRLYGKEPHCIQTMWNAIDDWVIRSSNFHSLYELYGHFTEPHPIFSIRNFRIFSKHPIAEFALHASDFTHCSRYIKRAHLTRMFEKSFGTRSFGELATILRQYRFDIRCYETNIAIAPDVYMVAYPFTLPQRRQMNFSLKDRPRTPDPALEISYSGD